MSETVASERRRHPRFGAAGRLAGHLLDQDLPVRVRDIGLGGFSIETMTPLETGVEHQVRFVSRDDWSTVLPARIANCRPSCAEDGSPLFVAGCSFSTDEKPETRRTVQILIEKVTSVQLYGTTDSQLSPLFDILHEDADLLVINKPAGLVCHPTRDGEMSSLVGRVRLHLGTAEGRLVNRLDRETSGVVLIGKNAGTAGELGKLLAKSGVDKRYWAIVHGHVDRDAMTIDAPLGKDDGAVVAIKDCVRADGAPARTHIVVAKRCVRDGRPFTWLDVAPESGRKHQIRIHLAHIGHSIVGDKIYGADERLYLRFIENTLTPDDHATLIVANHLLHARRVSFVWRGRPWIFEADPDADFSAMLSACRT